MNRNFPPGTKPEDTRHIDVSIDIDASVEEVWPYLGTSEGLSSWYVKVDLAAERAGVPATLDFGGGMVVPAQVETYTVNDRVRIGPPAEVDSPRVEEYRVKKRDGGCTVRIVNWGFGEGADWDAEYDAVKRGWLAFLAVLKRVVEDYGEFGAAACISFLSVGPDASGQWSKISKALGADLDVEEGDALELKPSFAPAVSGTVSKRTEYLLHLTNKSDTGGLLFAAIVEGQGPMAMISIGFRLFGDQKAHADTLDQKWSTWFNEAFPMPEMPQG